MGSWHCWPEKPAKASRWGRNQHYQAVPQSHQFCIPSPSGPSVGVTDSALVRCLPTPTTHPGPAQPSSATALGDGGRQTPDGDLTTQTSPRLKPSHAAPGPTSSPLGLLPTAPSEPVFQHLPDPRPRPCGPLLAPSPRRAPPWAPHTASPAPSVGAAHWNGCGSAREWVINMEATGLGPE